MNRAKKLLAGAGSAVALLLASPGAEAAPQVLAALTLGDSGEPFICDAAGVCRAEFSTYCLQKDRKAPSTGRAYAPAGPEHFHLVVIAADGSERRLAAGQHVRFMSARGFVAARALLDAETVRELGGTSARLQIAAGAALVPVPEAGDDEPLTEQEIAYARDSLRKRGEALVDAMPEAGAAALLSRLSATIEPRDPATPERLEQLWQDVIERINGSGGQGRLPAVAPAREKARELYEWCQRRSSYHSMGGIKSCLEFRHDDAIQRLNKDYWEGRPGY